MDFRLQPNERNDSVLPDGKPPGCRQARPASAWNIFSSYSLHLHELHECLQEKRHPFFSRRMVQCYAVDSSVML
eukprot:178346-Pyramimonas_sp.AAC.1